MNQIKHGAILSYISLGLSNIIVLLYTPFMLRMMGQSEYGLYSIVGSVVGALLLLDCGFGSALIRYIVRYNATKEQHKIPEIIGMFLILYSIIGIISLFFGLLLYENTEFIFQKSMSIEEINKAKILVAITSLFISLNFPFSVFSSIIVAYEKFIYLKITQILKTILMPLCMIPLLLYGYKAIAMSSVLMGIGILLWILNISYCFKKIKITIKFARISTSLIREIILFSSLVFAKLLLDRLFWSAGTIIQGAIAGTTSAALLAVALQMRGYYFSFADAINGLFLPRITNMAYNNDKAENVSNLFIKVGRIQMHLLGFIMCIYLLYGKQFMELWAGKDYIPSYYQSLIIMIPAMISLIQMLGKTLLEGFNKQKYHLYALTTSSVLMILLSLILGNTYKTYGIAISISISLIVGDIIILNYFYAKNTPINLKSFWNEIIKMAIYMCAYTLIFKYTISLQSINSIFDLIINVALFSFIYLLLLPLIMTQYERNLLISLIKK